MDIIGKMLAQDFGDVVCACDDWKYTQWGEWERKERIAKAARKTMIVDINDVSAEFRAIMGRVNTVDIPIAFPSDNFTLVGRVDAEYGAMDFAVAIELVNIADGDLNRIYHERRGFPEIEIEKCQKAKGQMGITENMVMLFDIFISIEGDDGRVFWFSPSGVNYCVTDEGKIVEYDSEGRYSPLGYHINKDEEGKKMSVKGLGRFSTVDGVEIEEETDGYLNDCVAYIFDNMVFALQILSTSSIEVEDRRFQPGYQQGGRAGDYVLFPEVEQKVITIKRRIMRYMYGDPQREGGKQRFHMRRGHFRHYKSGKIVYISPYFAGDPELGRIQHTYKLEI